MKTPVDNITQSSTLYVDTCIDTRTSCARSVCVYAARTRADYGLRTLEARGHPLILVRL